MEFSKPQKLALHRAMEMVSAPLGKTFFYRGEHKRIITPGWFDEHRLKIVLGPSVYAVTDAQGIVRYFGRHLDETPVYSRWFRHGFIHHQRSSRTAYLVELDAERAPLTLWTSSVAELRTYLPEECQHLCTIELAKNLEALWVNRWRQQRQRDI
jgi:hypothetical protein